MENKPNRLSGRGRKLLLPEQGNPFSAEPTLSPQAITTNPARFTDAQPAGAAGDAEGSDADIQALFGEPIMPAEPLPPSERQPFQPIPEPSGYTPEELAAMYPSTESERNLLPNEPATRAERVTSTAMPATKRIADNASSTVRGSFPAPMGGADNWSAGTPSLETGLNLAPDPLDSANGNNNSAEMDLTDRDEDPVVLERLVRPQMVQNFWQTIEKLENQLVTQPSGNAQVNQLNLRKLKSAKNRLLAGPQHYEDAHRLYNEVLLSINYRKKQSGWAKTWGLGLTIITLVWLLVTFYGFWFAFTNIGPTEKLFSLGYLPDNINLLLICTTILSGVLGGNTNALWSLVRHIAIDQDFDPHQSIWYIISPLLGGVLGVFVFLIFQLGGLVLVQNPQPGGGAYLVLGALAWVVGFQQGVAYQLVERTMRVFLNSDSGNNSNA
ncbi:MAG TPA: hypothetical protein PK299_00455 [Anaerolineales bacterium]|nr:hypothetical protein [Anaerolineales bacterium]